MCNNPKPYWTKTYAYIITKAKRNFPYSSKIYISL